MFDLFLALLGISTVRVWVVVFWV